jgi:hypothetical protein
MKDEPVGEATPLQLFKDPELQTLWDEVVGLQVFEQQYNDNTKGFIATSYGGIRIVTTTDCSPRQQSLTVTPWLHPRFQELSNALQKHWKSMTWKLCFAGRLRWWRHKYNFSQRTSTCASCGTTFRMRRTDAKYCSGRCRVAALRRQRKPKLETGVISVTSGGEQHDA